MKVEGGFADKLTDGTSSKLSDNLKLILFWEPCSYSNNHQISWYNDERGHTFTWSNADVRDVSGDNIPSDTHTWVTPGQLSV